MEKWKDCLAALVPCYDRTGGNATLIYTTAGAVVEDRRTVRWNLKKLARLYCIDLEAARKLYGKYLGRHQGVPLPFSPSLVLVPLKVRKVVGKNDGGCGYFNRAAVQEVTGEDTEEGFRSAVLLTGGHRIRCYYSPRNVERRLNEAALVLERFRQNHRPADPAAKAELLTPAVCLLLLEHLKAVTAREAADT